MSEKNLHKQVREYLSYLVERKIHMITSEEGTWSFWPALNAKNPAKEQCPKCKSHDCFIRHHKTCARMLKEYDEHLHHFCKRCEYDWVVKV